MNSKKLKQLTIFSIILTVAIVILTVCVIQTVNDEQSSVSADTNSTLTSYNNPYTVSIKESEAFVVTQQYCWREQEWGGGGGNYPIHVWVLMNPGYCMNDSPPC
ncbi:MAG: hypothetical protein PHF83_06040, partial [Candidatus Methanomethylophilus sp.]|nr:hypothetical protein [Methanomethylophilus sp.]